MRQYISIQNKKVFYPAFRYILLTGIVFFSTALQAQSDKETIDSLEMRLNMPSLSDDEIYAACETLSETYLYWDSGKSLEYAWQGLRLAGKRKNCYHAANFYFLAGTACYLASKLDSAFYYYDKSLSMLQQAEQKGVDDKEKLAIMQMNVLANSGGINVACGSLDLALDYYLKALDIGEKMNQLGKNANIYINVAEIHSRLENIAQAEDYFLKGEDIYRRLNDSIGIAETYLRLSFIYIRKNDNPKALEYAEEAYRIMSALPNVTYYNLLNSTSRLTDVWIKIPDYDKALEYALKSVEYAQKTNSPERISGALFTLAKCYLKQKKYKEAEKTAFRVLEMDSSNIYKNALTYQVIAEANIWLKNCEKAEKYYRMAITVKDEYSNQSYQSSIAEMEVKYKTEKKEWQITALNEKNRLMLWLSIAGGGLLLLGLASLFFLYRWTVQKRRLAEQQHELAEARISQLEQEKQLIATQSVFDGEVQERTRLARDLHDGLGGKLTCAKIYLQELQKSGKFDAAKVEQLNTAMNMLDDSVQEMRRVSHNLMPDILSHAGLKPAVEDFCRSMSPKIVFKYYGDETRIDLKLEVLIYRSIYELVNNALKYADASQILVQILRETDSVVFTVQDNGCGFDPTLETEGIGLQNIRTRVASFGGDMQIDSRPGEGTEINVELSIENGNEG